MEDGAFKLCPFCKEQIRQEAIKCRFCGEWLEPSSQLRPESSPKLITVKQVLPHPAPSQEGIEPNSMKAVGRALDETEYQQRPANPQKRTPAMKTEKPETGRLSVAGNLAMVVICPWTIGRVLRNLRKLDAGSRTIPERVKPVYGWPLAILAVAVVAVIIFLLLK
jgi:hypothetical protein